MLSCCTACCSACFTLHPQRIWVWALAHGFPFHSYQSEWHLQQAVSYLKLSSFTLPSLCSLVPIILHAVKSLSMQKCRIQQYKWRLLMLYRNGNWSTLSSYKKFELMLKRRVKAYSSSCLQTVSLSPAVLLRLLRDRKFFPPPSHLAPSLGMTPFEFMEKLYSSWN